MRDCIISGSVVGGDSDTGIRPTTLADYIGQSQVKNRLRIAVDAAKARGEVFDHVLLYGPPGLGKTTLACILAREMGTGIQITSGPMLVRKIELMGTLVSMPKGNFLFIDEIHRLQPKLEEILYSATEDFRLDVVVEGKGMLPIKLQPFTLVGATTKPGAITAPLRARFGIVERLNFYAQADLEKIILRSARILSVEIDQDAASEIARRSRGTPRVANRLLRRVRDYAQVWSEGQITARVAQDALTMHGIDDLGLDEADRKLLRLVIDRGPIGVQAIAASLGEEENVIEEVHEPYLMQAGLLDRTSRGRTATKLAIDFVPKENMR